jgi:hypothetical protein
MSEKELWAVFDLRAAMWERDQGEIGEIIAKEIRTVNTQWLQLKSTIQPATQNDRGEGL